MDQIAEIPIVKKYPALIFAGLSVVGLLLGIIQFWIKKAEHAGD
jgi:hypothetical protein